MKKSILLFMIFIGSFYGLFAQSYLLNEDFSAAHDTVPPSGWQNTSTTGTATDKWQFNNPGNRLLNFPVSPPFAIFDSQNYSTGGGPEVALLESKTFDASVSNNILLKFDHYFVGGRNGAGYVDVFNGSSWMNVDQFTDSTANPESKVYDISAFAGGVSNCKVRFRWEGDSSYYWAVDNIRVIAPLAYDLALTTVNAPVSQVTTAGIQPVQVTIKNFSFNTITTATVNWSVNNVIQPAFNWTGSLPIDSFQTGVTIGSYNFITRTTYNITVWITDPNGHADLNNQNDTLFNNVVLYSPLCGTYTVGGVNPDFTTIIGINAALKYGGVSCPVVFNFRNGTYNTTLLLDSITGTSAVNTITFQSESGDSSAARLYAADTIRATNYINFRHITLYNQVTSFNSGWLNIQHCVVQSGVMINNPTGPSYIQYNKINNPVRIIGGNYIESKITDNIISIFSNYTPAIAVNMTTATMLLTVENNNFTYKSNVACVGVTGAQTGTSVVIRNNLFSGSGTQDQVAIQFEGGADYAVTLNRITHFYNGIMASNVSHTLIANNIVQNINFGISCMGTNSTIEFNSVLTTGVKNSSYSFSTGNFSNQSVINNIFANTGLGYSFYFTALNVPAGSIWNHNDYYSYQHKTGYFGGVKSTLQAWQQATLQDSASQGVNPFFTVQTFSLPVNQVRLNDAGMPLPITTDIDGNTRGAFPDMGAMEFSPCAIDAGINEIYGLPAVDIYDSVVPVNVYLQNQGVQPLTSVIIHWSVDGVLQPSINWTGNLGYKDSAAVFLGTYFFQFMNFTAQQINAWTELPNGLADCNFNNDAAQTEYVRVKKTLCGTYTIGGLNPDFPTTDMVANILNLGGISCPVVFKIRDGNYSCMTLLNIAGSSAINTITFEGESGDSTKAVLMGQMILDSTKYITFHNLTVTGGFDPLVKLSENAGWVTFSDCVLNQTASYNVLKSTNPSGPIRLLTNLTHGGDAIFKTSISVSNGRNTENVISHNYINDYGIAIILDSANAQFRIDSNSIISTNGDGLTIYSVSGTQTRIRNNFIVTGGFQGVVINGGGQVDVSSNRILNTSKGIAVANDAIDTRITDNFIKATKYGIENYGSNCSIYFNSILVNDTVSGSSALFFGDASNMNVRNNIFSNYGNGYAVYTSNPVLPAAFTSDKNDLFSSKHALAFYNHSLSSLADWQLASGQDSSSEGVDPFFTSQYDAPINQVRLNNSGVPVGGVAIDIDSTIRGILPDIGAKEYSPCAVDAGINKILGLPATGVQPGYQPIHVSLQNQGTDPLTSVLIRWTVGGIVQSPVTWTGHLNYKDSISVLLGSYNFQFHNSVPEEISAWTDYPNGITDCNHYNDASKATVFVEQALCGVYTIGGLNPDFPTIHDAALALNYGGITCAVTFKIRNGIYYSDVIFDSIQGSSPVNTITFESESGDSSLVTLNGQVLLDGTRYITFRHMSIRTKYTSFFPYASVGIIDGGGDVNIHHCSVINFGIYAQDPSGPIVIQHNTITGNVQLFYGTYTESDVTDNTITAYNYGVNAVLTSSALLLKIERNIFNGATNVIYSNAYPGTHVVVDHNQINNGNIAGIQVFGSGTYEISANRIANCSNGIIINSTATQCFVVNNFIQATQIGIDNLAPGCQIVFNSINCIGIFGNSSAFRTGSTAFQIVKNNIFENSGSGYAITVNALLFPASSDFDFNDFYAHSGHLGYFNTVINTLSNWHTVTSKDPNSKDLNPLFMNATELRPQNRQINGAAVSYPGVFVDIDGEVRNQAAPDMGADEFIVDIGITELLNPTLDCAQTASTPVIINLDQFGTVPFENIIVAYSVNGGTVYTDTIPGSVTNGMVYMFNHFFNMSHYGNYLFKVWLVDNHDDNTSNDTLTALRISKPSPSVSFSYQAQCADAPMQFTGSASVPYGSIVKYVWDFGDGKTDSAAVPVITHRFDSSGTYYVSLYAYNNFGCYSVFSTYVTVDATPVPRFTIGAVCVNDTIAISNQSTLSAGVMSYLWDFGNGNTSNDSFPLVSFASGGTYPVTLHVSASNGCQDSLTKLITVHDLPQIIFPAIGPLCSNGNAVFISGVSPAGGIYRGAQLVNRYFDPAVTGPGNFVFTYTVNNSDGCTNTAADTISVLDPQVSKIIVSGNTEFCFGDSVLLLADSAFAYQWSTGATTSSIYVKEPGNYYVTALNAAACGLISDSVFITVHGNGLPVFNIADICAGSSYLLPDGNYVSVAGNYTSVISSTWGCDSIIQTQLHIHNPDSNSIQVAICAGSSFNFNGTNYSTSGIYYSTLINSFGCDSVVICNLTVNPADTSDITVTICEGTSYLFAGVDYSDSGNYTSVFTNSLGCDSTVTLQLVVTPTAIAATGITVTQDTLIAGIPDTLTVVGGNPVAGSIWKWYADSCGGTSIGSGTQLIVSPLYFTTYFVRAEGVCDTSTCVSASIQVINCEPPKTITVSDTSICKGSNVLLTEAGGVLSAGAEWVWYEGNCNGKAIGTGSTITVMPMSTTTYYVNAQGGGCDTKACVAVTIAVLPDHPASPGVITGPASGVCHQQHVTYSIAPVQDATSYTWTVPAAVTIIAGQGSTAITVDFGSGCNSSGTICVQANNKCGSSGSSCLTYTTLPENPCPVNGPLQVCSHQQGVMYNVTPVRGAATYTWSIPPGASIVSGQGTNAIQINFGCSAGTIKVKAGNACGSSSYCSATITFNCRFDEGDVVQDSKIYPDPFSSVTAFYFNNELEENVTVSVVDKTGRLIFYKEVHTVIGENKLDLDLSNYADGIYFFNYRSNEKFYTVKLIKE